MPVRGLRGAASLLLLAVYLCTAHADPPSPRSDDAPSVTFSKKELKRIFQHSPLGPPPADPTNRVADDEAAARLGQFLFFEKRFSSNGQLSCASCHAAKFGLSDGKPVAVGVGVGRRNTPSIWNAAYHRWLYWDGRGDSLWLQAVKPIEGVNELGGNRLQTTRVVFGDPGLKVAYEAVFGPMPDLSNRNRFPAAGRPVPGEPAHPHHVAWMSMSEQDRVAVNRVYTNMGKAIAAYERRLLSRRAPFDVFVEGLRTGDPEKQRALSPSAQRGLKLFVGRANCRLCHSGPNFTDGEFHNTAIPPRGGGRPTDPGRYRGVEQVKGDPFNAAGPYSDDRNGNAAQHLAFLINLPENWGRFKTPTLRNVTETAPYMHQGQFATLTEVLAFYSTLKGAVRLGHHKETILVPLNLTETELADLLAFLKSLTDVSLDPALLRRPASPFKDEG